MQEQGGVVLAISHSEAAGAQTVLADLGAALLARGHRVRLCALYPGRKGAMVPPDGLAWHHCLPHPPRTALDGVRAAARAVRLLRTWAPDAVLTALPAANLVFPAANLLCRPRARAVISHHSPVSTYNRTLDRLDGWLAATAAVDAAVCVSRSVRDSLAGKPDRYRAKAAVIANALPPAVEALIAELRRTREPAVPGRLIACGRLSAEKNHPVLIRAMRHLPAATLCIVGAGPDEDALRRLAVGCGVDARVRFLGWRSREETLALMAGSAVFVQPSRFEGRSLALVEAAKLGLPLVVSDVPSHREAVVRRDGVPCGALHDPDDDLGLATAVVRLLDDPAAREEAGALASSLGEEIRYSDAVDRYEALLSPGPRPPG